MLSNFSLKLLKLYGVYLLIGSGSSSIVLRRLLRFTIGKRGLIFFGLSKVITHLTIKNLLLPVFGFFDGRGLDLIHRCEQGFNLLFAELFDVG